MRTNFAVALVSVFAFGIATTQAEIRLYSEKDDGWRTDSVYSLIYDPGTGHFSTDHPNVPDQGHGIAASDTLEIVASEPTFAAEMTPEGKALLDGLFDVWTPTKLFRLNVDGFGDIDFGLAVDPPIPAEELARRLSIDGSWIGGGGIDDADLVVVPEPNFAVLLGFGILGLIARRKRRV